MGKIGSRFTAFFSVRCSRAVTDNVIISGVVLSNSAQRHRTERQSPEDLETSAHKYFSAFFRSSALSKSGEKWLVSQYRTTYFMLGRDCDTTIEWTSWLSWNQMVLGPLLELCRTEDSAKGCRTQYYYVNHELVLGPRRHLLTFGRNTTRSTLTARDVAKTIFQHVQVLSTTTDLASSYAIWRRDSSGAMWIPRFSLSSLGTKNMNVSRSM